MIIEHKHRKQPIYKPLFTDSLHIATTNLEWAHIFSPNLIASSTTWSTGKILLTNPRNQNSIFKKKGNWHNNYRNNKKFSL